jgi:hypothetical protein
MAVDPAVILPDGSIKKLEPINAIEIASVAVDSRDGLPQWHRELRPGRGREGSGEAGSNDKRLDRCSEE